MADAPDSKSGEGDLVWVQVPPPALLPTIKDRGSRAALSASEELARVLSFYSVKLSQNSLIRSIPLSISDTEIA